MKNTNRKLKIGALAVIAGLYSAGALAEAVDGIATATVITPLTINNLATMTFNTISPGTLGGSLVMDDAGGVVGIGDAFVVGGGGGTALGFDITGESGQTIIISVSNGVLSNGVAADDMALTMGAVPNLLLTAGPDSVAVGGVLTLPAGQTAGAYSTAGATGTAVTITANYQ